MDQQIDRPFRLVIAGGGVAALECALAVRALAGDRVAIVLVAPNPELVYRPLRVREPFGHKAAQRYPMAAVARGIPSELVEDSFRWLDPASQVVHTDGGLELEYD